MALFFTVFLFVYIQKGKPDQNAPILDMQPSISNNVMHLSENVADKRPSTVFRCFNWIFSASQMFSPRSIVVIGVSTSISIGLYFLLSSMSMFINNPSDLWPRSTDQVMIQETHVIGLLGCVKFLIVLISLILLGYSLLLLYQVTGKKLPAHLMIFHDNLKDHILDYVYFKVSIARMYVMASLLVEVLEPRYSMPLDSLIRQSNDVPFLVNSLKNKIVEAISRQDPISFFHLVGAFYTKNLTFLIEHISKLSIETMPKLNTTEDELSYFEVLNNSFDYNTELSPSNETQACKNAELRLLKWFSTLSSEQKIGFLDIILSSLSINPDTFESMQPFYSALLYSMPAPVFERFVSILKIPTFYLKQSKLPTHVYLTFVRHLKTLHLPADYPPLPSTEGEIAS